MGVQQERVTARKPRAADIPKNVTGACSTTLGARDFSSAVSGFCQVFIVTRAKLVASAYGGRCVGLRPTPKIPVAHEKKLWYPG